MRIFLHFFLRHLATIGAIVAWVLLVAWAVSHLVPESVPSWALVAGAVLLLSLLTSVFRAFMYRLFGF